MPISDRELEHIRRKQREFLAALLVRKWTTPRRSLGEQDALEAGRKVGLMPILVSEFLHYWVGSGDLDESWTPIAVKIQKSLGDSAFEQIEAGFPQDPATSMVAGGTEGTARLVFLCHASEDEACSPRLRRTPRGSRLRHLARRGSAPSRPGLGCGDSESDRALLRRGCLLVRKNSETGIHSRGDRARA